MIAEDTASALYDSGGNDTGGMEKSESAGAARIALLRFPFALFPPRKVNAARSVIIR
ncbi:MAG: hypothetical protein GX594_09660 [Pirellulaceae bacterium]|nr:hypothetical protein [Pirellulaceae bacterium]